MLYPLSQQSSAHDPPDFVDEQISKFISHSYEIFFEASPELQHIHTHRQVQFVRRLSQHPEHERGGPVGVDLVDGHLEELLPQQRTVRHHKTLFEIWNLN